MTKMTIGRLAFPVALSLMLGTAACSGDETNTDAGVHPDATVTNPDATTTNPDAEANPDATTETPDGGTTNPDAEVHPDASDPKIEACRTTIAAKETQYAAELANWSYQDPATMVRTGGDEHLEADYAGKYRDDLTMHPGCVPRTAYGANTSEPFSLDNEATVPAGDPATIAGYPCAAKVYANANEDTTKPIVILVHGNSSGVTSFEEYFKAALAGTQIATYQGFQFTVDAAVRKQLAQKLVDQGYKVIGFDARTDLVNTLTDYSNDATTGNRFRNIDHGWSVPMLEALIRAVITENPTRKISLIGHSLGVTTIRDALRRLYVEHENNVAGSVNPYAHVKDVVLLSGASHGVSSGATLCPNGTPLLPHMRSTVACEMGDRAAFQPTPFSMANNGPGDLFATPCADGSYAFGHRDACEGNVVQWTTMTMQDVAGGAFQDEFVSEASSKLDMPDCVSNELITLSDYDTSGYFFTGLPGFIANHFGTPRSDAAHTKILSILAD